MIKNNNRGETNLNTLAARLKEQEENLKLTVDGTAKDEQEIREAKSNEEKQLIFVNGKLDKSKSKYLSKNIYIHEGLYEDLKSHCKGLDQAVFNYLLYLGLNFLKEKQTLTLADVKEVEIKYDKGK